MPSCRRDTVTKTDEFATPGQRRNTHHVRANPTTHRLPVRTFLAITTPVSIPSDVKKGTNTPAIPLPSWMTVPNLPANLGTIACLVYSTPVSYTHLTLPTIYSV